VGLVVPKQKHSSVERNRLKRRLRELVRTRLLDVLEALPPADVVIRSFPEAYDASFASLERQVEKIAGRLRSTIVVPPRAAADGERRETEGA
jgi:ribonuclease P protein component